MIVTLYFVTFLMSVVALISLLLRNKRVDSLFFMLGLFVSFNCLGRFLLSISTTMDMAIWATRILYIGAMYCPVALIMVLAQLCDLEMPKWVRLMLVTASSVVLGFVFTVGYSPVYYKEMELVQTEDYSYLVKTYGPAHALYPASLVISISVMVFYIFFALKKRKTISMRTVVSLSATGMVLMIAYIIGRVIHSKVSFLSVGYLFAALLLQTVFERFSKYDLTANIAITMDKMKEYGYIALDRKMRYVNSNPYCKELFPEIEKEWQVDRVIKPSMSQLYQEIICWAMDDKKTENLKTIRVNDLYLDVTVSDIIHQKNKKVGYLIEFVDRTKMHEYTQAVEDFNQKLQMEVEQKTEGLLNAQNQLIMGMATMVESRDNSTGGHIRRTSGVVRIFEEKLLEQEEISLSKSFLRMVRKAAPMHDLGKIAVDDSILRKQGKYNEAEYAEMKKHSEEGAKILERILRGVDDDKFVDVARNIAWYHHEKWDGSGYPAGLSKEQIPVEARIMALADVFDALVSKRCYKEAFSYDKAFSIIEESLGTHFDPKLGKLFISCRPELEMYYDKEGDK